MICVSHPVTISFPSPALLCVLLYFHMGLSLCVHAKPIKWGVIYLGHATQKLSGIQWYIFLAYISMAPTGLLNLPLLPLLFCGNESRGMQIYSGRICVSLSGILVVLFCRFLKDSFMVISILLLSSFSSLLFDRFFLEYQKGKANPPSALFSPTRTLLIRKVRFTIEPITDHNKLIQCKRMVKKKQWCR